MATLGNVSPLEDRYRLTDGTIHATGVQALARLPLDVRRWDIREGLQTAGFIAGYEGSPLGGYDLELFRQHGFLDEFGVVFRPAVNEEIAATAVQGTQLAATMPNATVSGITGYWYGKSPGLDRATDSLRHNNLAGTHPKGGAVAFVGDDPAAKSSTAPGNSDAPLADLGIPIFYPADSQDVLDFGMHAVAMSRVSGLWSAVKILTNVADGAGLVTVHPQRFNPVIPTVLHNGAPYVHQVTGRMLGKTLFDLEESRNGIRFEIAKAYIAANPLNVITQTSAADRIGIIASGKTYLDVQHALQQLGFDADELARRGVRLLKLGVIWPVDEAIVTRFADGLDEIIVVEEKRPFIETAVKDILFGRSQMPQISGKKDPAGETLLRSAGDLDADVIAVALARRLSAYDTMPGIEAWRQQREQALRKMPLPLALAERTPYFCSGCPHNSSTKAPEGSLVGGGIGCHSLSLLMNPDEVGSITGLTQMGGEGAQWIGMSPFVSEQHLLQNIGDGTFHHSGSLAVRGAIASGVNMTYKILYNAAVAMTGGQQAVGAMNVAELTFALHAEGVKRILVTTEDESDYEGVRLAPGVEVWHRDRIIEAQETLAKIAGVTVLIHDQECATELRRKRKRQLVETPPLRVMINERLCEGCGDCGEKSNCLSVQPAASEFGRKTRIDQSTCNLDFSCLKGDCPSFITIVPGSGPVATTTAEPLNDTFDEPTPRFTGASHTTRILGVGGTGVVTLSQILSVAATLAGLTVRSLDQTGLAQKGGAVISDVKVGDDTVLTQSNKTMAGECDLYLGADLLVAAQDTNLQVNRPGHSFAVVSTTETATGQMVTDTSQSFPDVSLLTRRITETCTPDGKFIDARRVCETLFGHDQFANMLLVGIAYQAGALPIPADAIEAAIHANGVKTAENVQAFRRGRQMVADPDAFFATVALLRGETPPPPAPTAKERALIETVTTDQHSELHRLLSIRVPELVAYQNLAYAKDYVAFVQTIVAAEQATVPNETTLSETVAFNLHKLMAYKDEYEVARLALDPAITRQVQQQFGQDAKMRVMLHPPALRALGLEKKLALGPWFRVVFRVLRAAKPLRGTPFDLFGLAKVRRVERALPGEYKTLISGLLADLSAENYAATVTLAGLPDMIRGYEDIKLNNVAKYRESVDALLATRQPALADRLA